MSNPFVSPTESSPSTPVRPTRSVYRMSTSNHTTRSLPLDESPSYPPRTPSTPPSTMSAADSPFADQSPRTPTTPTRPALANRKSSASIRRKPVPLQVDDLEMPSFRFAGAGSSSNPGTPRTPGTPGSCAPSTPASIARAPSDPPTYVLPVDPPSYPTDIAGPSSPYSHSQYHHHMPPHDAQALGIDVGGNSSRATMEDLPMYSEEKATEPQTLARSLWKWGWLCPLLWAIGMCIMWIPLRPTEDEADPEKAQKLEEMIVILREAELKYAKRCMWGFLGFVVLLVVIVGLAVVLPRVL